MQFQIWRVRQLKYSICKPKYIFWALNLFSYEQKLTSPTFRLPIPESIWKQSRKQQQQQFNIEAGERHIKKTVWKLKKKVSVKLSTFYSMLQKYILLIFLTTNCLSALVSSVYIRVVHARQSQSAFLSDLKG